MTKRNSKLLFAIAAAFVATSAGAKTYSDNFDSGKASLQWLALDDACLTAGTQSGKSSISNPIIPSCASKGISVRADEKIAKQGALLLTPATNMQTGAILSAFDPFPLTQGIQITFTTYTFSGDSGGTAKNGADGIVFFLTDGTKDAPTTAGGSGGSMGYGCSNGNDKADGIEYGYLGLGIDEFGNFLNSGDNGSVGIYNSRNKAHGTKANGDNSFQNNVNGSIAAGSGPQYQPERIGLRGSGNTNWKWLKSQNSSYYSGSFNIAKAQEACRSGKYVSSGSGTTRNPYKYTDIPYNYDAIAGGYAVLPDDQKIANNSKSATRNPTSDTKSADIAWPITYRLTISSSGLLNFAYSYNNGAFQPVLANADITKSNGPLPASLRFGFSAGTGGSNNIHEITCFQASPLQSNSSAGANTVTGKVTGDTQFFLASYSEDNWWGSLVADPLVIKADGDLDVGTDATWDAKCALTGGKCDSMGTDEQGNPTHSVTGQDPTKRTLLTWNAGGVDLSWSSLSAEEQSALNTNTSGATDGLGKQRVDWLHGIRSVEQLQKPTPGNLRARTYVLGDIINSSPTFVGAPRMGALPNVFKDSLDPDATVPENDPDAQKYSDFVSDHATRQHVVYVGGNDGFMHGFRAGAYKSDGTFDTSTNDGNEVLGYMPYGVLMNKAVNLADPLYKHDYMVDATPVVGDVFYGNEWHTWLVGGVGSNGREIFALDVTDPSGFAGASPASLVMGDWDSSALSHLGNAVGTPIITRMHTGQWAIVFGSGLIPKSMGSPPTEGVYVGLIDSTTGKVTFHFLDTKAAPTGVGDAPGGISYVSQVDLDGDATTDYLYAGDTQGNVWRFDVTGNDVSTWTAPASPMFVAKDGSGNRQPITTSIMPLAVQTGVVTRVMLYFGTGQQTPATTTQGVQYAKGTQTYYGIWDADMGSWNAMSNAKYASLTNATFTRDDLLAQTVSANPDPSDLTHRYLDTTKVVCWKGDAATTQCPTNNQFGWSFDMPGKGPDTGEQAGANEQAIYNPAFIQGAVVVNTAIPPVISAAQCNPGLQTGWTMAFNPETGGGFPEGYFPDAGGGFGSGSSTVGGTMVSGVGTPTSVQYGGNNYLVTQTVTGGAKLFRINPPSLNNPSRVSWRELVNP